MGFKKLDNPGILDMGDHTLEEIALFAELSIKRFKADDGRPILTAGQLAYQSPRPEESLLIKTVYDRFSGHFRQPQGE